MKNRIDIISRDKAVRMINSGFPDHAAVISFYDPRGSRSFRAESEPVDYSRVCRRVFSLAVYDIDPEILEDYGLTYETYLPEADALAAFIAAAVDDGCHIICQCEYGQSRSAACAAAIREYYDKEGIVVFADYRYYPNPMIFNKILAALRARDPLGQIPGRKTE